MFLRLVTYAFADYHLKKQSALFRKLLYGFVVVRAAYWFAYYDLLFGSHSVIPAGSGSYGPVKGLAYLLYFETNANISFYCLIGLLALTLAQIFNSRYSFVSGILCWFLVLNINNRIYTTLTGGDILLQQLLFFSCLLSPAFKEFTKPVVRDLAIFFHNLALVAIVAQICLVYFLSGFSKFNNYHWIHGDALASVLNINYFNPYFLNNAEIKNNLFLQLLNYLVLFYQLLFPVLIWIQKIKRPLLLVGILMHLYIMLVMGLVWFGLIMTICYALFWPFSDRQTNKQAQ